MIVDNFYIGRSEAALGPFEADSPPDVDTDAPLALSIALQGFETVARPCQVANIQGSVELVQLAYGASFEAGKSGDSPAAVECLRSLVPEADDQCISSRWNPRYVKRNAPFP